MTNAELVSIQALSPVFTSPFSTLEGSSRGAAVPAAGAVVGAAGVTAAAAGAGAVVGAACAKAVAPVTASNSEAQAVRTNRRKKDPGLRSIYVSSHVSPLTHN